MFHVKHLAQLLDLTVFCSTASLAVSGTSCTSLTISNEKSLKTRGISPLKIRSSPPGRRTTAAAVKIPGTNRTALDVTRSALPRQSVSPRLSILLVTTEAEEKPKSLIYGFAQKRTFPLSRLHHRQSAPGPHHLQRNRRRAATRAEIDPIERSVAHVRGRQQRLNDQPIDRGIRIIRQWKSRQIDGAVPSREEQVIPLELLEF